MRISLPCGASASVSADIKPQTIEALNEMFTAVKNQYAPSLPMPVTEEGMAWAEQANMIADVLRTLSDQFNGVDNGRCTLCRERRLYNTKSKIQACENEACLSHVITAILHRYNSPSAGTPEQIKRNCERLLFEEKHGDKPAPNPCGDLLCQHPRRKHLNKHYKKARMGSFRGYHYGACREKGCKCMNYQPRSEECKWLVSSK